MIFEKKEEKKNNKEESFGLPSGKIIHIADNHLELASTFRCKTSMHLNCHGVSHLSQLSNRGSRLLLKFPQYRHSPRPSPRVPHTMAHDKHRRRADCRGAHYRRSHRHLSHHHQQDQLPIKNTLQRQIDSNLKPRKSSKFQAFPLGRKT